ncbi:LpqB family beta-propeller domain-containing protein [Spongiactinospora gelatinilytica]|uniref:LpqB family beta-propeller domain-containing protein n=1 Tax=Spongiactinospora gelatinilytica TaxID=2666298 RepID=UPI000DA8C2BA|nr:LpqB family beta-propeller domain-containing protein [Spongiactinospora gelatinilytica]
MTGGWRRRLLAGCVALAAVAAGSGCATIPTGSPAEFEEGVQGDPLRKPYVRMIAIPPRPEWGPAQVLEGFLAAMAAVDDPGWSVARRYLTGDAARSWRPNVRVTVYDKGVIKPPGQLPDNAREARVTLQGTRVGAINDEGKYSAELEPQGGLIQEFKLVKEPTGWRIGEVPHGLLLTEADIRRSYRKVKLYYLDSTKRGLVVDEVRVPLDPKIDFAESIVRRLLKGPTATLREAVRNALPAGTRLRGVWTEDDKVIVDLNEAAANAISSGGGDDVDAMAAQIGWTLNQLTERWEVEIRVNGDPYYASSGTPLRVGYDRYGHFDPWLTGGVRDTYVMANGALHTVGAEGKLTPVAGQAGQPGEAHIDPAVAAQGRTVAALNADGDAIEVAPLAQGGQWRRWITGENLTAPSWDRYDTVWTVARVGERSSRVYRHDGTRQVRVAAAGLETVGVQNLRVARDGVRVAAVVEDQAGVHVKVGIIMVQASGTQIVNLQTLATAADGQKIVDIAWRDATTLLVLTSSKSGQEIIAVSVTDGTSEPFKADARIDSITAFEDRIIAGVMDPEEGKSEVLYWDSKGAWVPLLKNPATSPALPLG